ncbi:hypothetical protein Mapa_008984 [Marchantia paleacea]|nr:hypothetical protein Mapa_008984 [Marchantia paleacea]
MRLACALAISMFLLSCAFADKYHISITTKRNTGVGRVAEVCMAAFDEVGDFQLSFCPLKSFSSSFQSRMQDNFYMMGPDRAPGTAGRLCQLALRFSKGTNVDGWNVKEVVISDRNTGENFVFHVNKLLRMKQVFTLNNCSGPGDFHHLSSA